MKERIASEISMDDSIFSPLIIFSLYKYSQRHKIKEIQSNIVYNLTLQTLENLALFPPAEQDPKSFAMGIHIYNPIYENSVFELKKQGLIETKEENLLLTEEGLKVLHLLLGRINKTSSTNLMEFLDKEVNEFSKDISFQTKTIFRDHKEIITLLRGIGSKLHQYSPNYPKLTSFQKRLLYWLYKLGEIQKRKMIELCQSGAPLEGHNWKSLYDSFDRLKDKGLVIKTKKRKEVIKYTLSKLGKDKAKSFVDKYNEL